MIETIPDTERLTRLLASGGQTLFTFGFPIFAATDLDVRRFRGGVETLLAYGGDYQVIGAGEQGGGSITLAASAMADDLIVIRSAQDFARSTQFTESGDLRGQALNDEFNRLMILFQQLLVQYGQTLRLPTSDPVSAAEIATAAARVNSVLGFGAAGEMKIYPVASVGGGAFQQAGSGSVATTVQDELAERIHPRQFGGAGDDSTDDTQALQRAANQAAAIGGYLDLGRGSWRISDTVTVPGGAAGVLMRGLIRYAGPSGRAALVIGDGGAAANRNKQYLGLRVERVTQADWTSEADIGIQLRNLDACFAEILQAEGFTIGVQTFGDGRGFEDSTLKLGRLANNRIQLDIRTGQSGGWNNAVRYIGGHFANASATHPLLDRFGVRFSRASGAYNLHNHHVFYGPSFELQNQGGAVAAIPFLSEVNSRSVVAHAIRVEGNSPTIARHTAGAQDHIYEVAFSSNGAITGTEGNAYLLEMDYPAGATRAGGTIVPLHQAAAVVHAPRLIAGAPSLRATAFRANATETGFKGLALLAGNPAGPPTTLTGLAFRGLSSITLNADTVTLPTSRALGFVVDCSLCKDFALGFEGSKLRPTVMLFDASEAVLDSSVVPLASNQSLAWNSTAQWWQATADAEDASYTRLQRITVPAAAKYAVIGIGSSDAASVLKALRLYAPEIHAPAVLAGGGRGWGTRELTGSATWDPPSVAAAGTTTTAVTVAGAAQGDQVQVSFSLATTLAMVGVVSAADTVTVRLTNPTGATVDMGSGTVSVRVEKPRA